MGLRPPGWRCHHSNRELNKMLAHRKTTENVGPHTDAESHHPFNADKMKQGPRYIILATKMRHGTIWSKYALYEQ